MQKKCFVIMGFGKKTDYRTGRSLDLDITYQDIIKPAAENKGLRCVRADEIKQTGTIDKVMFEEILSADVVIADLSTYNCNTFYELGVRHGLKPYTTIIISEKELEYPFDLSHIVIKKYKHLETDIGNREVARFKKELEDLLEEILNNPKTDSPVYTFIQNMQPPTCSNSKNKQTPVTTDENIQTLSEIIKLANQAKKNNDFAQAKTLLSLALKIAPNDSYLLQQYALVIYKSEMPTKQEALQNALEFVNTNLNPNLTTDAETLGIFGAINKRLYDISKDLIYYETSLWAYEKAFYLRNDYYNGINLAFMLNVRAEIEKNIEEKITYFTNAKRIRAKVISICNSLLKELPNRDDQYWVLATLEEAYLGIDDQPNYKQYQMKAENCKPEEWQRKSTNDQILKLSTMLKNYSKWFQTLNLVQKMDDL